MDIDELKSSKHFCMAPFAHIRNICGVPAPCCMVTENVIDAHSQRNLKSAFHSPEWDELRRQMLAGEPLEICTHCYSEEEKGLKSLRLNLNEYHFSKEKIENPRIRDIDMAMSNKCNFKCVTCGVDNSSAWYDEEKILKDIIPRVGYPFEHNNAILDSSKQIEDVDQEYIEIIRLLGGEPFLDDNFLKFLQGLDLPKVKIFFVTNCSIFPKKWIETLEQAKEFVVMFSIDGIGEVGEFVRYGFKQRVFERNLIKWLNFFENKKATIYYHYACHVMNVFNYDPTFEYLSQFEGEMYLSMVEKPKYLNLKYLPERTKEWMENQITNESIKSHLWSDKFDNENVNDFLKYIYFLEEHRKTIPKEIDNIFNAIVREL